MKDMGRLSILVVVVFISGCQQQPYRSPEAEAAHQKQLQQEYESNQASAKRRQDEIDAYEARTSPEDRARGRSWWNCYRLYRDSGYKDDEAAAMATKLYGPEPNAPIGYYNRRGY